MDITTVLVAILGSSAVNSVIAFIITRIEKKSVVNNSLRLLMKDRLRFLCMHYINQGWIYEDELEDIMAMHSCYHNDLKGNGFLDKQMEKVMNLEVRGIGVK